MSTNKESTCTKTIDRNKWTLSKLLSLKMKMFFFSCFESKLSTILGHLAKKLTAPARGHQSAKSLAGHAQIIQHIPSKLPISKAQLARKLSSPMLPQPKLKISLPLGKLFKKHCMEKRLNSHIIALNTKRCVLGNPRVHVCQNMCTSFAIITIKEQRLSFTRPFGNRFV